VKENRMLSALPAIASVLLCVLLLPSCSVREMRMSPTMAVLDTAAYSPDGKFIAAGRNIFNVILIYDASTVQYKSALLGDLENSEIKARSLSISRDGKYVAAAGIDDMVVVWDIENDQTRMRLSECKGAQAVAFSPTENLLAAACAPNIVTLWRVPEGIKVAEWTEHSAPVLSVSFSLDGSVLATGGVDRIANVWRVADLKLLDSHGPTTYPIHSLAFTPDRSTLALYNGDIKTWN
jgi:WD40 repeat protein